MAEIDLCNNDIVALINALEYYYDHTEDDESYDLAHRLRSFVDYKSTFPMQPIEFDASGVARFKANKLVEYLLNFGTIDMNQLGLLGGVTNDERMQFAQLIGYSVSGFGDLHYAHPRVVRDADTIVEEMIKKRDTKEDKE